MKRLDLNKINKKYIDEIIEYFIYEIYNSFKKPVNENFLTTHLENRIKNCLMDQFIIDYNINIHLGDKQNKRDDKISFILDDKNETEPEYYIEVAYRMSNKSFYSIKINEDLLNSYGN